MADAVGARVAGAEAPALAPGADRSGPSLERWLKAFTAAVAIAWAAASLTWPFGWDQGILAWIGSVINGGGVQYRDAWDQAGPLPPLLHALADRIFGRNTWGIRVVDLCLLFASAWLLRSAVERLTDRGLATWAALLFVLWYASGSFWHTAQRDGWAAMALVAALAPLIAQELSWSRLTNAGLLLGCTTLVKPYFAVFVAVAALAVWHSGWPRRTQVAGLGLVLLLAGVPVLLTAAWFAGHGALDELFEAYVRYPLEVYASPVGVEGRVQGVLQYALTGKVAVLALPAAACGLAALWRDAPRWGWTVGAWALLSLLGAVLQGRFFEYHWIPLFAPAIVLAAAGIHRGTAAYAQHETAAAEHRRTAAPEHGAARALPLFVTTYLVVLLAHALIHPLYDVVDAATRGITGSGLSSGQAARVDIEDELAVAAYVRARTEPADRILVWGWNASIYYLGERRSATRFGFSMPLLMGEGTELHREYRTEFLDDIGRAKPRYIVIGPLSANILGVQRDERDFAEFWALVETCYTEERRVGVLRLYRLRAASCLG